MKEQDRARGYRLVRGALREAVVEAVDARLRPVLDASDPADDAVHQARTWAPALVDAPWWGPFREAALTAVACQVGVPECRWGRPQVAFARPGGPTHPPDWHLDGLPAPGNGVHTPWIQSFTVLMAVFLTDSHGPCSGNLHVWPASTDRLARWYRQGGRRALYRGRPAIDPGEAVALEVQRGDVLIANYLLAHSAGPNPSEHPRRAVFFRGAVPGLWRHRWASLADPWRDWPGPVR